MMDLKEIGSIGSDMGKNWAHVVEESIRELMRVTLCLPNEISMVRLPGGRIELHTIKGFGYRIETEYTDCAVCFRGIPFYESPKLLHENNTCQPETDTK